MCLDGFSYYFRWCQIYFIFMACVEWWRSYCLSGTSVRYFSASKIYAIYSVSRIGPVEWWGSEWQWQEVRGSAQVPESDVVQACRRVSSSAPCICLLFNIRVTYNEIWLVCLMALVWIVLFSLQLLDERQSINVWQFLEAMNG